MKTKFTNYPFFERLSTVVSKKTGSTPAFILALTAILVWLVTGPIFNFSDTWQLVINTSTTIITFLMVFLIQRSQNKESLTIQIKLNELIASSSLASNRLINIEDLTEDELDVLEKYYVQLVEKCKKDKSVRQSHSIAEATELHEFKTKYRDKLMEQ